MRTSEIKFTVELDNQDIPDKIFWEATDSPSGLKEETKAIALSLWDGQNRSTMKIDLWSKDMPVQEMKLFYVEAIRGMAESLKSSTGDDIMYQKVHVLCQEMMDHIKKELKES